MKRKAIGALGLVLIMALGLFMSFNMMNKPLDESNKEIYAVTVENGSGTAAIAQVLYDNKIISNTKAFRILSKFHGNDGKYTAGTYGVSPSMSMDEIQEMIVRNETMANYFTVIEGQTVEKIAKNLETAGVVSYKEFMKEEENGKFDYDFLKGSKNSMYRLEGYLFPDTYEFQVDTDAHDVINQMLENYAYNIDAAKVDRKTLIVASIVEREAGIPSDMPLVASVIYNRLDIDMALQMDSIVSYVLQEDKVNLSYNDIDVESAYNPYKNKGLPPGPICCPGKQAIEAALSPEDTEYLYFVVSKDLDGSAKFTDDYDQFLKDKDEYYKAYEKKFGKEAE